MEDSTGDAARDVKDAALPSAIVPSEGMISWFRTTGLGLNPRASAWMQSELDMLLSRRSEDAAASWKSRVGPFTATCLHHDRSHGLSQISACLGSEAEAKAGSVRTATRHYGAELKHVYGDSCLDSNMCLVQTAACAVHSRQVKLQLWRYCAGHLYEAVMQVLKAKHVYANVAVSGYVAVACLITACCL